MHVGIQRRLAQLLDDMRRRRQVGIAHAEVNDIRTIGAQACLGHVHLLEHVGRQAPDLVEIQHHVGSPVSNPAGLATMGRDGAGKGFCKAVS